MSKAQFPKHLADARARGDKEYEQQLLDSYKRTYGEDYQEE